MKVYDVGLVIITTYNYGNDLTNYSLYDYLKSLGYSILVINVPWNEMKFVPHYCKDKCGLFLENPISQDSFSTEYESRWDIDELNNCCKMFVVGADQLWHGNYISSSKYYTCLDWVQTEKYKIAYSTSIGNGFADLDIAKVIMCLKRFHKIGLREEQIVKRFDREYGIKAAHVMDPVFLHNKDWYHRIAKKARHISEERYLAAYLLDSDSWKQEIVNSVVNKFGNLDKHIVSLPPRVRGFNKSEGIQYNFKTEEWLDFIEMSEFVITDSFHGVCFALIFQKQFLVLFNKNSSRGLDRITSLLNMFGLDMRLIMDEGNDVSIDAILKQKINYRDIGKMIEYQVKNSKAWLEETLNEGEYFVGESDIFDVYRKEYYCLKRKLEISILSCQKMKMESWLQYLKERFGIEEMLIWGAGGCFLDQINKIQKLYVVDKVFDNDERKWGKEYCPGIACLSPDKIDIQEKVIVLVMSYSEDIYIEVKKFLFEKEIKYTISFKEWEDLILKI